MLSPVSRMTLLAWAGLLINYTANAHMIMAYPIPYSVDKVDSSPLSAGDFPCKQKLGFTVSTENKMAVGEKQTLSFKGTAVHGGGSCQLAVTLDRKPSSSSTFKVIKSIEGACPGVDGGPSTFDFEIPKEVPNGEATFSWTWFSKLSGAPEMYQNCAPITVTGGASDSSAFDSLPDMFVANIPEASCTSPQNFDTKFPNPGSVVQVASSATLKDPTGSSCGAASGSNGSSSSGAAGASSVIGGVSSSVSSLASVIASTPTVPSAATTSQVGGVFAPGASSIAPTQAAPSTTYLTTMLTVTASSVVSSATAPVSTGSGSTSSGNTCSQDGALICNGETQFGLCDHGAVVWQPVAAGTTCSNGAISRRNPVIRGVHQRRSQHSHQH